jgi:hypothetical protein
LGRLQGVLDFALLKHEEVKCMEFSMSFIIRSKVFDVKSKWTIRKINISSN